MRFERWLEQHEHAFRHSLVRAGSASGIAKPGERSKAFVLPRFKPPATTRLRVLKRSEQPPSDRSSLPSELAAITACAFIGALLIVPMGDRAVPEVVPDQMSAAVERQEFEPKWFQPQATYSAKLEGALERKPPINALAPTELTDGPSQEFIVLAEIENQLNEAVGPSNVGHDAGGKNVDASRGTRVLKIPPQLVAGGSSRLTKLEPPRGYQ